MQVVPVRSRSTSPALGCQQNSFLWNVLSFAFKLSFNHNLFFLRYKQGVRTIVACPKRLSDFLLRGSHRRGPRQGTQVTLDSVRRTQVGLDGRGHTMGMWGYAWDVMGLTLGFRELVDFQGVLPSLG